MKILHITAMAPLSPNSGIPVVLKQLSDYQNRIDGISSIVLSLKGDIKQIDSTYFYFLGNDSIASFISSHKPDIAIIHSFFHIEYAKVASVLKKFKIPFLIEPHGSFGRQAMEKSHVKKVVANKTIFRSLIKDSAGYIYTNKAEYKDSIYRTRREMIIPNGIIMDVVNSASFKSAESIANPSLYYLGRYDIHHKGLDYLFDALDILDKRKYKLKIFFYGTGDENQIEYVSSRIKRYSEIVVKECGPIYGDEKKRALEASNILILTSRYEGSPMTVLDGLSFGNPCIATPGTNIAEEVQGNNIGWSANLSAESIAETIIRAVEDYKTNGQQYFERCKEYVINHYSWERISKYSVKQYKKII